VRIPCAALPNPQAGSVAERSGCATVAAAVLFAVNEQLSSRAGASKGDRCHCTALITLAITAA